MKKDIPGRPAGILLLFADRGRRIRDEMRSPLIDLVAL